MIKIEFKDLPRKIGPFDFTYWKRLNPGGMFGYNMSRQEQATKYILTDFGIEYLNKKFDWRWEYKSKTGVLEFYTMDDAVKFKLWTTEDT